MTRLTPKGEHTRTLILETALRLFRQLGYEKTTMRRVAKQAGVSLGSTYYYFQSKEHLIQAFYRQTHLDHEEASEAILETSTDLSARLIGVLRAKLETSMPYHRFSGILFKTAADPQSPLSPFSPESEPVRQDSIALMRRVVEGSSTRVRGPLAQALPTLLWLYEMGIILYWIHDRSQGCRSTFHLMVRTSEIVCWLIRFANIPLMRPLVRSALQLVSEMELVQFPEPSPAPGDRPEGGALHSIPEVGS